MDADQFQTLVHGVAQLGYLTEDNISTVQELSPGEFIISTDGKTMSLVCAGQANKIIRISGGLYILKLPSRCRINGQGWTLTGMARRTVQSTVSLPVTDIAPSIYQRP